jgi:glutamate-1-semialdehyde 2,1-aminomutase
VSETNAELIERGRRVTASEVYDIGTRFPAVIDHAEGSWMTDVEGNRILDVTAAGGALLLGNCHPAVTEAITRCIASHGTLFASTLSRPRLELSERLIGRYPACEKVVFAKSGSEATTAAIRLARQATGRDLVLTAGYHGWHDWQRPYQATDLVEGQRVIGFGFNLDVLARLLDRLGDRIAGVIVTPEPAWFDADFYRQVGEACRAVGGLFVLDEVLTGFRYGPHGVNGSGDVPADLVTISKGLANGHALAAVMGRQDVIDTYDAADVSGTYTREVPPMAAAVATLDAIADGTVHQRCEAMGGRLRDGMRAILDDVGIPAHVTGPAMMFDVVMPSEQLSWAVYRAAFDHGAWFEDSGTQMVTAAYGDAEVDAALEAFEKGCRQVAAEGEAGNDRRPLTAAERERFAADAFGGLFVTAEEARSRADIIVDKVERAG